MKRDPLTHFERLAEQARAEVAPSLAVTDAVLRTIQQRQLLRLDDSLRATLWFAVATSCTAAAMLWLAWPAWEMTVEPYALLWSPLAGTLP
ncbi:MAG: hypothetical protein NT013_01290 [Planctomycetia bacterium]|nr:hypothetical protein [Planctomycetia bacterium]